MAQVLSAVIVQKWVLAEASLSASESEYVAAPQASSLADHRALAGQDCPLAAQS